MKDLDTQFLCKDCSRYNLCKYYDRRKGDSYICKYFHLTETFGMTNGEVIQALFPEVKVEIDGFLVRCVFIEHEFTTTEEWWNAPYKKGGEE